MSASELNCDSVGTFYFFIGKEKYLRYLWEKYSLQMNAAGSLWGEV